MPRRTVVDPRFGARLRELREARGLSLRELGRMVPCTHVHIHLLEHGRSVPSPEMVARLDAVLGTEGELAALLTSDRQQQRRTDLAVAVDRDPRAADRILANMRTSLVARRRPEQAQAPGAELTNTATGAHAVHDAYQRADYAEAARLLPGVVAAGEHLVRHSSGAAQQQAYRVLAIANIAASKLATKLGDGELAWITADRAASSAWASEAPMVGAVAAYQIACALLNLPDRLDGAAEVVAVAIDELSQHGETTDPAGLSARGTLILLGAIVAARQGDRAAVTRQLDEAEQLAATLGRDGNHLYTGFGPTNLMIHQVGIAVELQRPELAIQIGDQLDISQMPAALVGRRAQVHLDLASAYAQTAGGDSPAVLHLLAVERIAPQVFSVNQTSRTLLGQLVERERRSATPGLRALASRAGVLT